MCGVIALILLVLAGLFGYSASPGSAPSTFDAPPAVTVQAPPLAMTPTPTSTPDMTGAAVPTQLFNCAPVSESEDEANMLALVGGAFQPALWTQQLGSDASKTTATWIANAYGAVAFLEYLHYDCGIPTNALEDYYSPAGFDVLLSNYTSHEQTAECAAGDVRLFKFNVTFAGADYVMDYWVARVSSTRAAGLMLVFPAGSAAKLDGYAERLFPQLPDCEAAG